MLAFTSAILLLTLNSVLAAPLITTPAVDVTHLHHARNLCPSLTQIKISQKNPGKLLATTSKLKLGPGRQERTRCIYPIMSGLPGKGPGAAAAVTPALGQPADLREFSDIMLAAGDLIQRDLTVNSRPWAIVNRSGKHLQATTRWKQAMGRYPNPAIATKAQSQPCYELFDLLLIQLAERIKTYGDLLLSHKQLNFDRILLNDDWTEIRFIDWPENPRIQSSTVLTPLQIWQTVTHLNIQSSDGTFFDDDSNEVDVHGTCQTKSVKTGNGLPSEHEHYDQDEPSPECTELECPSPELELFPTGLKASLNDVERCHDQFCLTGSGRLIDISDEDEESPECSESECPESDMPKSPELLRSN